MILLVRLKKMLNDIKPGLIFMIPVFLGCESAEDLGIQYELQSDANVRYVEFTLPNTNIKIDSLRTDDEVHILVGNYADKMVGSVNAEGYFAVQLQENNIPDDTIREDFVFNSIRFAFAANTSIPLASSKNQSFSLYELEDDLARFVYLSNKKEALGSLIGRYDTLSYDAADTLIGGFDLSKDFGQNLFDLAKSENRSIQTSDWPSIAISPNAESNSINQIKLNADTTAFYLYINDPDGREEVVGADTFYRDTTYTMKFGLIAGGNTLPHYTHLNRDDSQGVFSGLQDRDTRKLESGRTIIDPIAGISTSISLEALDSFFNENRNIIINRASITFEFDLDNERDTLKNFNSYFFSNGSFFAPGLETDWLGSLILKDEVYLGRNRAPATSKLTEEGNELVTLSTLFFQTLFNNYYNANLQEELEISGSKLFMKSTSNLGYRKLAGLVLLSVDDVTLQRLIIRKNGVKLKIYYTDVD